MDLFESFPLEALPALSALAKHCGARFRDDWKVTSPEGVLSIVLAAEQNLRNGESLGYPGSRVFDEFCDLCITGQLVTFAIVYPAPPRGGVFVLPPDRWNVAMPKIDFRKSEVTMAGTRYLVRFLDRDAAEAWIASQSQGLPTDVKSVSGDADIVLKRAVPDMYKQLKDNKALPEHCTGIGAARLVASNLGIREGGKGWEMVLRIVRSLHNWPNKKPGKEKRATQVIQRR
jgi:hypothetical protein